MRIDFLLLAMDQIINHAAKWHYMFGGKVRVPITIRAIMGKGWGSGAQHSQSFYSIFTHFPGLKVILPASPYDAKGLLIASIKDNNPVIIIEHRWSYDQRGIVPEEPYSIPLGKADLAKTGKDVTVIVSSLLVAESMQAAQELESDNIDTEVINLRTIKPMDKETIFNSVKKTGKAVIVDMGNPVCGIASEISALLVQNVFEYLKAPVKVITLPDTPVPSCHVLEQAYFPNKEKIKDIIKSLM
jgi:pyruvate dehydrogenase E1 component beta subunit